MALTEYSLELATNHWESLPVEELAGAIIERPNGSGIFRCQGNHIIPVLKDRHVLSSMLLLASYALIEAHVENVLEYSVAKPATSSKLVNDFRAQTTTFDDFLKGGIEAWGTKILTELQRTWTDVAKGKAGLVEVSTVRNALAHGENLVTINMVNRVTAAGGILPWSCGGEIKLTPDLLNEYRARLRSFARVISTAAVTLT